MVDDAGVVPTLREIVSRAACTIAGGSTHVRLDEDLVAAGLPPSTDGSTKGERGESSAAAVPDARLREVAVGLVERYASLHMIDRKTVQDLVWADEYPPAITKRTRRNIARTSGPRNPFDPQSRAQRRELAIRDAATGQRRDSALGLGDR